MLSPEKIEENKKSIIELLRSTNRNNIENIVKYLEESDFFTAPASTKYHNNFLGGLADHSLKVYKTLVQQVNLFKLNDQIPTDSIIISALLHDICKVNFYEKGKKNVCTGKDARGYKIWEEREVWNVEDKLGLGHGDKSIIIILENGIELSLWEKYAIRWHMSLQTSYEEQQAYNTAHNQLPSISLLHVSDLLSSMLLEKCQK